MRRFLIVLTCILFWWQQDILVERSTAYPILNDIIVAIQEYLPSSPLKTTLNKRDTFFDNLWENRQPAKLIDLKNNPSEVDNTSPSIDNKTSSLKQTQDLPVSIKSDSHSKTPHLVEHPDVSSPAASTPVVIAQDDSSSVDSVETGSSSNSKDELKTLIVAGDSMASGVAISLRQIVQKSKKPYKFIDLTKHSTGLINKAYYDWPSQLEENIRTKKPDVVVFFIGANDAQGMKINKSWYRIEDAAWAEEYAARIQTICHSVKNTELYWVGLPPMEKPDFNEKIKRINAILENTVAQCGNFAHWISISDLFGGDDYIVSSLIENKSVKLRAGDGIHMTYQGYELISKRLWNLWYTKDAHD